jgi:hypothetical protein
MRGVDRVVRAGQSGLSGVQHLCPCRYRAGVVSGGVRYRFCQARLPMVTTVGGCIPNLSATGKRLGAPFGEVILAGDPDAEGAASPLSIPGPLQERRCGQYLTPNSAGKVGLYDRMPRAYDRVMDGCTSSGRAVETLCEAVAFRQATAWANVVFATTAGT